MISSAAQHLLTRTFISSVSLGFRLGPNFFLSFGLGFAKVRTFGEPGWVFVTPLAPERHENQDNLSNETMLAFWPIGLKARTTHGKSWNVSVSVSFSLVSIPNVPTLGAPRPLSSAMEVHPKMGVRKNTVRLPLSSQIKISFEIDIFHQRRALKKNL